MSAADQVGDALAGFAAAAAAIDTAADLNNVGRAVAMWMQDASYAMNRVVERIDAAPLREETTSKFHAVAAEIHAAAAYAQDELDRPVVTRRW